jgi:uncharacterized protein (TIGR02722 family)
MSTKFDKRDLEKLFKQNEAHLESSGLMKRWKMSTKDVRVAVFPIKNETSEHVDSQLETLLAKFETALINSGTVTVISRERQRMLIEELKNQRSAAFDPSQTAQLGKQLGAQYFVTGKLTSSSEKSGTEKRVQYFLFMQAVEIETGAVRWQTEANLTKGLIN